MGLPRHHAAGSGQHLARGQQVGAAGQRARRQRGGQVGAQRPGQPGGTFGVELPGALHHQAALPNRQGRVLQDGLHERRRQAGVGLQQHRSRTCHCRSGHRGARQLHQPRLRVGGTRHLQLRVAGGQQVPGRAGTAAGDGRRRHDLVARRHQVGLDEVVYPAPAAGQRQRAARGPARAETGDGVVGHRRGAIGVERAYRDDRRLVPGRNDGAVNLLPRRVLARVAGGGHHHQARCGGAARGAGQRVDQKRVGRGCAQAHVDDADVGQPRPLQHPVHAQQRVGHGADAALVEHAHVVQAGPGRDAAAAGSHGRHVGAVAVGVGVLRPWFVLLVAVLPLRTVDAALGVGGVVAALRPAVAQRPAQRHDVDHRAHTRVARSIAKLAVPPVDAAVEHCNADASAVEPACPCPWRGLSGRRCRVEQAQAHRTAVGCNAQHVGACGQRQQGRGRHHGGQPADRDVVVGDRAAPGQDVGAQRAQFGVGADGVDEHLHVHARRQGACPRNSRLCSGWRGRHGQEIGGHLGAVRLGNTRA